MNKLAKTVLRFLILLLPVTKLAAQDVLAQYIDRAFEQNLVIKEKKVTLEKSLIAIKEARSLFLPHTWFETQYTLAQGGRTINIPIGDLLNPVYRTLNQLTSSNSFPTVTNVKEQFLPDNFYDVRIKTTMPLINPDISIQKQIKIQEAQLKEVDIRQYKRELVKEIKQAYFNYLMSKAAERILEENVKLVQQNLKLNQSLLKNGKGLPAYVVRAESELISVENQLLGARNTTTNAVAYFNFLLNRPLTDTIITEELEITEKNLLELGTATATTPQREELKSMNIGLTIAEKALKMNRSYSIPRINGFMDLAAQGFNFTFNRNALFYLGGLQLQIPIFAGNRNHYKINQTKLDIQGLQLRLDQTSLQLQLASLNARNNARNAYYTYTSTINQVEAANQYFRLIDRGYREGVHSFIEFLDARNQLTSSQILLNIHKYRFLANIAEYERQSASYIIQ